VPLRGNIDTRLRKLETADYDAIVLAFAGLHRMNLPGKPSLSLTYLPIDLMMPAPGQGALALECRDEPDWLALLAPLQDFAVQATTTAERTFMRHLGAGCYLPIGAYGEIARGLLTLRGLIITLDGQQCVHIQQSIPWMPTSSLADAAHLGVELAERALKEGANEIISALMPTREQIHA
jgi:hydroxymethylbilane synthase